jgi:hypothetical protein
VGGWVGDRWGVLSFIFHFFPDVFGVVIFCDLFVAVQSSIWWK